MPNSQKNFDQKNSKTILQNNRDRKAYILSIYQNIFTELQRQIEQPKRNVVIKRNFHTSTLQTFIICNSRTRPLLQQESRRVASSRPAVGRAPAAGSECPRRSPVITRQLAGPDFPSPRTRRCPVFPRARAGRKRCARLRRAHSRANAPHPGAGRNNRSAEPLTRPKSRPPAFSARGDPRGPILRAFSRRARTAAGRTPPRISPPARPGGTVTGRRAFVSAARNARGPPDTGPATATPAAACLMTRARGCGRGPADCRRLCATYDPRWTAEGADAQWKRKN